MAIFAVPFLLLLVALPSSSVVIRESAAASASTGTSTGNNNVGEDPYSIGQSVRKLAAENDNPRVLNVHIVPHTHDDVGWRKTVEQYYYGLNTSIDERGAVNRILSSTVQALTENTARTFTYAEVKFFSLWWNEQNDAIKDTLRNLIATNQWTFVNGGWCMHDEAASHFMGMMDQTTLGHQFLLRELGVRPRTGWQLDPFGHSATQANLLTYKAGMDALYFGRIDYQDLNRRKLAQECEGWWDSRTSRNSGVDPSHKTTMAAISRDEATVFWGLTGSYGGNYGPPPGFCFDVLCPTEEPLVGANTTRLLERVVDFLQYVAVQSEQTRGNHIMMTMGEDFTFKEAHVDYSNLDLLIGATMNYQQWNMINVSSIVGSRFDHVNIFYSNPDYYTDQKHLESDSTHAPNPIEWPTKEGDFFPYSDCPHCFWTGYFTSRAAFKRFERVASSFLMAARQIMAMPAASGTAIPGGDSNVNLLFPLEDAMGIAQHHDAISGTAKQHVADDYSAKIAQGMNSAVRAVATKLRRLMLVDASMSSSSSSSSSSSMVLNALQDLGYCPLLNETICPASEDATLSSDTTLYVIVYNPIAQSRSTSVRLPVSSGSFRVERLDESKQGRYFQSIPLRSSADGGLQKQKSILVFDTGDLPPLGAVAFKIAKVDSTNDTTGSILYQPERPATTTSTVIRTRRLRSGNVESYEVSNGLLSAVFDASSGALLSVASRSGNSIAVNQTWGYYESYDNAFDSPDQSGQNSGAYIFRPRNSSIHALPLNATSGRGRFVRTANGMEIHVAFQDAWIEQVYRIAEGQSFIESEYMVGPVPTDDGRGREIITRWSTPIKSSGIFHTDSNGREFLKRQRDYRTSWDLEVFEPIAGNYYPVNAAIYIEDATAALSVLVDRSQGGSSLLDGSLELMVQRRTMADDYRGVDEPLNETTGGMSPYPPYGFNERVGDGVVIIGKHRIVIGDGPVGAKQARLGMDSMFAEPIVFIGSSPSDNPVVFENAAISGLAMDLPENVMLLTYMQFSNETFLIRFGHQFALGEDETLSKPVEIDVVHLFTGYEIVEIEETTLTANDAWLDRLRRRQTKGGPAGARAYHDGRASQSSTVTLAPMEVKTLLVKVQVGSASTRSEGAVR